jgi:hypothetical protein
MDIVRKRLTREINIRTGSLCFFHFFIRTDALLASVLLLASGYCPAADGPLQIGWWTGAGVSNLERIDAQNEAGQTLQVAYHAADPSNYLAKLQETGIKTFLSLDPDAAKARDTDALVSFVNAHKDHPAIAGWFIFDEPEFNDVGASVLVEGYQAVKAADPDHPVAIVFGNGYCSYLAGAYDPEIFNAADIIMYDKYPVFDQSEFGNTADGRHPYSSYPRTVTDCLEYLDGLETDKEFIMVAQGFQWSPETRNPTYAEERFFTFMPFVYDVAGLLYWVDYRADAELTSTIHQVMKEASAVGPALVNGVHNDPSMSVSSDAVNYKYGPDGADMLLIALNNSDETVTAEFTLPASVEASEVNVLYEGYDASTGTYQSRSIQTSTSPSEGPAFTDTFTQYQVHIYQVAGVLANVQSPSGPIPGQADASGSVYKVMGSTFIVPPDLQGSGLWFGVYELTGKRLGRITAEGNRDFVDLAKYKNTARSILLMKIEK